MCIRDSPRTCPARVAVQAQDRFAQALGRESQDPFVHSSGHEAVDRFIRGLRYMPQGSLCGPLVFRDLV
eukprot:9740970-Alexandrium_andersonii.AAC.1